MRTSILVCTLLALLAGRAAAQVGAPPPPPPPPTMPTEAANPPQNDVWLWIEQPVGWIDRGPLVVKMWAFRCGGTITAFRPSVANEAYERKNLATLPGNALRSGLPRPDIVTALQARCPGGAAIPVNIGYELTIDLTPWPSGPDFGYTIDAEVTDDYGRKTKLRQVRGSFQIR